MINIKCIECNIKKDIESITKAKNKGWSRKNNKWYCPHCCKDSYQHDTHGDEESYHSSKKNNDDDNDDGSINIGGNFSGGSMGGGGAKW